MMKLTFVICVLFVSPASAQQQFALPESNRITPYYQQQRNTALDNLAACAVIVSDLQTKIAELEKKIAELNAAQGK